MTFPETSPAAQSEAENVAAATRQPANFDGISQPQMHQVPREGHGRVGREAQRRACPSRQAVIRARFRLSGRDERCPVARPVGRGAQNVGGLNQILWRNRSLQEFFTAYVAGPALPRTGRRPAKDGIYTPDDP